MRMRMSKCRVKKFKDKTKNKLMKNKWTNQMKICKEMNKVKCKINLHQ